MRDVRERLAERLPRYARGPEDPTDPGWVLLEEAAWLVEVLSEQLDRYPFAVVQQLLHVLGGQLRPAQPAVGAVVAAVSVEGTLKVEDDLPSPWRLYTPQNERKEAIEFVPAETEVPLWKGRVASLSEIRQGELFRVGRRQDESGLGALIGWRHAPARSAAFDRELIRFTAMTNNAAGLLKAFQDAIARVGERSIGWLKLSAAQVAPEQVALLAEVDVAGAFSRSAPGGIWTGGDLDGDWGTLDDSTWTPPVTLSDHPLLPPRLRGQKPYPAAEEGKILIPNVPADFPVAKLLVRRAAPTPSLVVEAIWKTVASQDTKLLALRPSVSRGFKPAPAEEPEEPSWLAGALERGLWARLSTGGARTVTHLTLNTLRAEPARARVGLVLADVDLERLPAIEIWGIDGNGVPSQAALAHKVAWCLPAPPLPGTRGQAGVVAIDVPLGPEHVGFLVVVSDAPMAVLLNVVMVVNAPAVRDGRRWTVQRNVPESVSLLFEDVITPEVVGQLLEQPIPESAGAVLRRMPLSWLSVEGQPPVQNFAGASVDPTEGKLTFNAPDGSGTLRPLRPGSRVRLDWYRRTDGQAGEVPAGAISLVEQPPETAPSLAAVTNPLGTFFGADRESPEAAIDRMAVPSAGLPVLPADWERLVRQALGNRGLGWMVRVWTYAERSLLTTALWPPDPGANDLGAPVEPETARLKRALENAGPEVLLVVVGPLAGDLTDAELEWARQVVRRQVKLLATRLPTVRDAIVTRFWPLRLRPDDEDAGLDAGREEAPASAITLPAFSPGGLSGELADARGRSGRPPRAELILNAAVTEVLAEGS